MSIKQEDNKKPHRMKITQLDCWQGIPYTNYIAL